MNEMKQSGAPAAGGGFSGYHIRPSTEPDAEITRVGPGTPCGEYLRRFWHPVAMTQELGELPLNVRILGEDLVLFRDRAGRYGLLGLHCSHRGTSLEFGIPTDRGLRCCYHGWLYDVDGALLEAPGEPATTRLCQSVVHPAYPVREHNGLVFAYMGPPDAVPEFPIFDAAAVPGNRPHPYLLPFACNWLQVHENGMDPAHSVFLHTLASGTQFTGAFGVLPITTYETTRVGMISTTVRRCGDHVWIRSNDSIAPNVCQFGPPWEDGQREKIFAPAAITRWIVPWDDTHCMTIGWRHFNDKMDPNGKGRPGEIGYGKVDFMGQTPDRTYDERQREPGDWDAQVSQGPIAIHKREHLGTTDAGVGMLRQLTRRGIRAVKKGENVADLPRGPDGIIATYAHDTVLRVTKRDNDDAQLAALGKAMVKIIADSLDLPQGDRQPYVERRVRAEVLK